MISELKNLLLNTGYFKDNEYLTAYISLIDNYATDCPGYEEKHHIIPVAVYRYKYNCKNGIEARKMADVDEENFRVSLLYKDHVLAHYFLYFCTKGVVKKAMGKALICMVGNLEVDKLELSEFKYLPEQFEKIQQLIDHIYADPNNNFYTPYEIEFLKTYYGEKGSQFCADQLGKPVSSIKAKAHSLRLHLDTYHPWSDTEIEVIKQYYEQYGPDYCNNILKDRDKNSICGQARRLGLQCRRLWSEEDTNFLIENYSKIGGKKCAELLNRPYGSVRMKANKLDLISGNLWTKSELELLQENYCKGASYCAEIIKRSPEVIRVKANQLGISEVRPNRWSDEEIAFLKENYKHGSKFCAEALPCRTRQSITRQANKLGLKIKNRQK